MARVKMPDEAANSGQRRGAEHLAKGLTARQLEVFAALLSASAANEALLPGAAVRVGVQPGTISQTLELLERNLGGVKLTETVGKRTLRITRAAEQLAPPLAELLASMERLTSAAARVGSTRSIRVSCYPAHLVAFVGRAIAESDDDIVVAGVTDEHRAGSGEKVLADLGAGRIDWAIAPLGTSRSPLLACDEISQWHLAACHGDRFPNEPMEPTPIENLARDRILASPEGYRSRSKFDAALAIAGIEPSVLLESPNVPVLLYMGSLDWGIPIVPCDALPIWEQRSIIIGPGGLPIWGQYGAWYRKSDPPEFRIRLTNLTNAVTESAHQTFEGHRLCGVGS